MTRLAIGGWGLASCLESRIVGIKGELMATPVGARVYPPFRYKGRGGRGDVGLEGRWMGMNLKRDEEGGRERERCLNVVIAGATEEVAYVSGPLDARGGVWV
jgi:hypothetical protein